MKNSLNIHRLLEIFWLIVAVLTGLMSVYTLITDGIQSAYMFMIMCALSTLLYLARRGMRRKNSTEKS